MNHQRVNQTLLRLPEAERRQTWGHPTFRARGKIFASLPESPPDTVVIKASPKEQTQHGTSVQIAFVRLDLTPVLRN